MTRLWDGRRVVVCVGPGGVGKTTVSAALGIAAAASGLRTLVMTIDPARRLANALGLADFGHAPHEIPAAALAPHGVKLEAPLWAMMPDVARTFDELIERTAKTPAQRDRILSNRIYQQFAGSLAGALEYAAVEKLYEVESGGSYDLVVLDTPPLQNVTSFLGAPQRIVDFLEQDSLRWLLKPSAPNAPFSTKLLDLGGALVLRTLGKLAGSDTMRDLVSFLVAFQGMYDGFRERATAVQKLLASPELAFVLVGTARGPARNAVLEFHDDLIARGYAPRAAVLNRVHTPPYPAEAAPRIEAALQKELTEPEAYASATSALAEEAALAQADANAATTLKARMPELDVIGLPELPLDVHDLASLALLHRYLGAPLASRRS